MFKTRVFKLFGWRQLAASIAYCQTTTIEPINTVEQVAVVELNQVAEQLTHKYLLQQTCTMSVNSSCQMITIALVALIEASQKYKNALTELMDVLENNTWSDDELENILIEWRSNITDAKTFYLDSVSIMDSALQLGQSSLHASFTIAANSVFNAMSEKLYSAEREFQSCIEDIKKVEDDFAKLLADTMKKSMSKDNSVK